MDMHAFMDPSGGKYYSETINSGLFSIGVGLGMEFGIPRLAKSLGRRKGFAYRKTARTMGSIYAQNVLYTANRPVIQKRATQRLLKTEISRINKITRGQKIFAKAIGWTYLISGLVEIGSAIATPGVSRLAAEKDQQLMADERGLDSAAAYTQRQRALMAIHDSQMTVRGIIGQEASYMHR